MARLEELRPGLQVTGIIPRQAVSIVAVKAMGAGAMELTYKRQDGQSGNQLLYASDAEELEIVSARRRWKFTADGAQFRLAAEAYRIHLCPSV